MANYNFKQDLELSEAGVQKVKRVLAEKYEATDILENHDKRYDLSFVKGGKTWTMEVKEDFMSAKTGNVAIELMSRDKDSGIRTSEADMWLYILGDEFFVIGTKLLRELMPRQRKVYGGDGGTSYLALMQVDIFKEYCKKIA